MFTSSRQYGALVQSLISGRASAAKISLGLLASRIGAEDLLRFCPVCARADEEVIGIATWYRVHQLPGVLICPYHAEPLIVNRCLAQRLRRQQLFLPTTIPTSNTVFAVAGSASDHEISRLLLVARLSAQLLSGGAVEIGAKNLRRQYQTILLNRDLATTSFRVRQAELRREFGHYWSMLKDIPPFSNLLATCQNEGSWLQGLCRKPRSARHPLKHVLLIGFLADSIESFLRAPGPPPTVIPTLGKRDRTPVERQITKLHREGKSVREIAGAVAMSPNTVLVMAEKLGLPTRRRPKKVNALVRFRVRCALAAGEPITKIMEAFKLSASTINRVLGGDQALQLQRTNSLQENRRVRARTRLLSEIERMPTTGFKALRSCLGADFAWLYRNDRQWLIDHLQPTVRDGAGNSPVDWKARDCWMVRQIRLTVEEISTSAGRPMRVTIAEIGRRTGYGSWLDKQLGRMPQTKELLAQVLESVAAFQLRRLAWWEQQLGDQIIARWRVIRAAGLRRDVAVTLEEEPNS